MSGHFFEEEGGRKILSQKRSYLRKKYSNMNAKRVLKGVKCRLSGNSSIFCKNICGIAISVKIFSVGGFPDIILPDFSHVILTPLFYNAGMIL